MNSKETKIELFDKRDKITTTLNVEKLDERKFRMIQNSIFNYQLTHGTEFETTVNKEGKHEVLRITKESDFITRRFSLPPQFKESDYLLLGEEIVKQGGYWQVDFGSIATINLPQKSSLDIDEILATFDFKGSEIIE